MSCTFWMRRKKRVAKQREEARLNVSATVSKTEKVAVENEATPQAEKKKQPKKKETGAKE